MPYTDYSILAGSYPQELDNILTHMQHAKLNITEEVTLEGCMGVIIDRQADGAIYIT